MGGEERRGEERRGEERRGEERRGEERRGEERRGEERRGEGEERRKEGTERSRPVDAELRHTINGAALAGVGDAAFVHAVVGPRQQGRDTCHTRAFARGRCVSILRSKKSRSWWSDAQEHP